MRENNMDSEKSLIVFQDKKIRSLWHESASKGEDSGR
ncbi:MAG: hypothetical protein CHKLHMKO_00203 [Candidatus Argoarchaeum ethanivorans]|uniref:Uncharacterized protein n=1 Tax=Candidatus Argoarchaeum ethanivorans TaxID=2608793 RepID=A0A811T673_9EURY|nr:MAG: hypothetical protein CHKLHMKO_00203 [Candidatus Argoarchaeum ethanivorans]